MASIPASLSRNLTFPSNQFSFFTRSFYPSSRLLDSTLCRCSNTSPDSNFFSWRWDSAVQDVIRNVIKRFDSYMNPFRNDPNTAGDTGNGWRRRDKNDGWDWDRWKRHFEQVDEQERLLSLLKSQLHEAVHREDYEDAARLKVAIAAAATNDTVGRVISNLNVGWWAGLSDDTNDPYGLIIRITAEHGRYVVRSISPRQLSTAPVGATGRSGPSGSLEESDLFVVSTEHDEDGDFEEEEDDDDADDESGVGEGLTSFQNILRDMIPGVKVKVLKVSAPGKVDQDFISKRDLFEMDGDGGVIGRDKRGEIAVKVVVGGLVQKLSSSVPAVESVRVPAKLVKKGRLTFSFSIETDVNKQDSSLKTKGSMNRKSNAHNQHSMDNIMLDLAEFVGSGKEKIPLKVLKDVGKLINLTLNQAQNQPLSGSTTFHRIETDPLSDPLNGLYIGAHGLHTSEVIHLRRKFGQWQGDGRTKEPSDLEFYEYVEAVKLTGDPYVPAGQVAFRARVGKRYQLPHKGIIPEEFGVVARYKGQGRLAEPGFRNPRWVDGELLILDGKVYLSVEKQRGVEIWACIFDQWS
ncbi:hypothetical protein F3Y22_tig00110597pilonHSYRG00381 [Hibiscus syriacus]|uniref:Uncharacterized protein n=1 Tax=Hibiscus syriacus TaxID=106335 RepID=A0A6A3A4I3_HIBSY|nr:hypothetical protein F3Y22_tig00110597pilonHSYRG00381 [Hibiscus syriacus]